MLTTCTSPHGGVFLYMSTISPGKPPTMLVIAIGTLEQQLPPRAVCRIHISTSSTRLLMMDIFMKSEE